MKSLIPKKGKESALNVKRTESTSNANKKDEQSKLNPSKKSDKESIKLKKGLIPKHQNGSTFDWSPINRGTENAIKIPSTTTKSIINNILSSDSEGDDKYGLTIGNDSPRTVTPIIPVGKRFIFGSKDVRSKSKDGTYNLEAAKIGGGKRKVVQRLAPVVMPPEPLDLELKPKPLATIINYDEAAKEKILPYKGKIPKEPGQPFNFGKLASYIPLATNVLGNTIKYFMSKPTKIGVIKPEPILNANRTAVAQVAPVRSLFRENFDTTAGKVRPAYFGADDQLRMLAGKQAQETIKDINFKKAAAEGDFKAAQQAALIQAENSANQANVANLNSDTANLNANNAQNAAYQQAKLNAEKQYAEENYARKAGFIDSLTSAIGGHYQQRQQLGLTKGMMDLANLQENYKQAKLGQQYATLYGKAGADLTPYQTDVDASKKAYDEADNAFKKKYNLG